MAHTYSFERLKVWHDAKILTILIYKCTKHYPDDEKFGLISQMRRCAISVCSNIAEGSSRKTGKDQAHFYTMAYSSLVELLNQSIISIELSYLDEDNYHKIRQEVEKISNKINSLQKKVV